MTRKLTRLYLLMPRPDLALLSDLLSSFPPHQPGVPGPQGQPQVANKIVAWTGVLEWQEVKVIYSSIGVLNASSLPLHITERHINQRGFLGFSRLA